MFAERVLTREEGLGKGPVHERDPSTIPLVGFGKRPALEEGYFHHAQIQGRDGLNGCQTSLGERNRGRAFRQNVRESRLVQRQGGRDSGGFDGRKSSDAGKGLGIKRADLLRFRVFGWRKRHVQGEYPGRLEAEQLIFQESEAVGEHPGHDKQEDGGCDLAYCEDIAGTGFCELRRWCCGRIRGARH